MTATAAVLPAAAPRATPTPEPRDAASSPGKFDRQLDAARQKQASPHADGSKKAPSNDHPDNGAKRAAPGATAAPAAPVKATADTATATGNAPAARNADDDTPADGDTSAAALASAMLALLGPANVALRPLAAGIAAAKAGPAGKTVAGDASFELYALGKDAPVMQGVAFSVAGYDRFSQRISNVRAARDAEIRDAKVIAEQIRTQIAARMASRG